MLFRTLLYCVEAISSRFQVILMGLRFLHLGEFLGNEDPRQFH